MTKTNGWGKTKTIMTVIAMAAAVVFGFVKLYSYPKSEGVAREVKVENNEKCSQEFRAIKDELPDLIKSNKRIAEAAEKLTKKIQEDKGDEN